MYYKEKKPCVKNLRFGFAKVEKNKRKSPVKSDQILM